MLKSDWKREEEEEKSRKQEDGRVEKESREKRKRS